MTKLKLEWEETGYGNLILKTDWGMISYNQDTSRTAIPLLTNLRSRFTDEEVTNGEETALQIDNPKKWGILSGDFRKEYEKVFPDKEKCLRIYNKHKKLHHNIWSTI